MKKLALGMTALALLAGTALPASASNIQTVDGRNQETAGNVTVRGIVGDFDNTVDGPSPENINEWINVTLPVTALFRTVNHTDGVGQIASVNYTLTNNSFMGVSVEVGAVTATENIGSLNLLRVNEINLIENGQIVTSETGRTLAELTGNTGANYSINFGFNGNANLSEDEVNPSFVMPLTFSVVE